VKVTIWNSLVNISPKFAKRLGFSVELGLLEGLALGIVGRVWVFGRVRVRISVRFLT